jgi:hypothetical protein
MTPEASDHLTCLSSFFPEVILDKDLTKLSSLKATGGGGGLVPGYRQSLSRRPSWL